MAADFLVAKGYTVIARNYRHGKAEIDLIVQQANLLVFVEVKSRTSIRFGYPEQAVSKAKAQLIIGAAEHYIFAHNWLLGVRYDIVAITYKASQPEIVHLEDAFY